MSPLASEGLGAHESQALLESVQSGHLTRFLPARWRLCGTRNGSPSGHTDHSKVPPLGRWAPRRCAFLGRQGRVQGGASGAVGRDPLLNQRLGPEANRPPVGIYSAPTAESLSVSAKRRNGAWFFPAFQRGSGSRRRCLVYPLAGCISCLALKSQRGGGGWRVRFPPPSPRPEPSISPQLTCETQGWEPQHYSVTKSRFIGT